MGRQTFTIVEYGAGTGLLCRDILFRLQEHRQFYERLNYFIIEKSGAMRAKEKEILPGKVDWKDSIRDIAPVTAWSSPVIPVRRIFCKGWD
jgi:SAM-dependent MidA family methyltransferase